jgi:hypothetical protein
LPKQDDATAAAPKAQTAVAIIAAIPVFRLLFRFVFMQLFLSCL